MRARWYLAPLCVVMLCGPAQPAGAELTTSDQCGSCHRDIFRMWRKSGHADAMEGAAFLESFRQSQIEWGEERSRMCLECHAPMINANGDWQLHNKITWEGVSCDACHSIVHVEVSESGPQMQLDFGSVKRGPVTDAASDEHEVAYSALHEESLVCAPCHEYANAEGTPILTTFSEWQQSQAAANGETCQDCHMWRTAASIVDPRVKRVKQATVNLHEMPGGHSLHQLLKALDISYDLSRTDEGLDVDVRIANLIGHAVPTGMPGREIVLRLRVDAEGADSREVTRVFGKSFIDATGEPVTTTWGFFEEGVEVATDTRIAADSTWSETIHFGLPKDTAAYFRIRLEYRYLMEEMRYEATRFEFFSERRTVRR